MSDGSSALNPYAERGMIRDPRRFFGRKRELDEIFSRLATMQSVSLVGERRIGKSSLLFRVAQIGAERGDGVFLYLDLQRVLSTEEFYQRVCQSLGIDGNTHRAFEEAIAGKRVILCLDEFEQATDNPDFDEEFFNVLRSLAQTGELALVVATQHLLSELSRTEAIPTSPFHNIFSVLPLGPLTEAEARELVTRPAAEAGSPFEEAEVSFLLALAQTHPYWLNVACALLYEAKQQGQVNSDALRQRFEEERRNARPAATVQAEEIRDQQPTRVAQPARLRRENTVALRVAALLAAAGTAVGWLGAQAANPVGVLFAGGLLLIALWVLIADWVARRRREAQ